MDPKYFKRELGTSPTEPEYVYWKQMLSKFIQKAKIEETEQLDALFSLCGPNAFPIIEDCKTLEGAIK